MAYNGRGVIMALDNLPKDPMMLLSFVNTRLRDEGLTLEELASQFGVNEEDIKSKLDNIGFSYNNDLRKFI